MRSDASDAMRMSLDTVKRTSRAMRKWKLGEDVRNVWRCLSDKNYRSIMTGEWVDEHALRSALESTDDPVYTDWCVRQNLRLREKSVDGQVLYLILSQYRDHIVRHGGICAEFGVFQGYSLKRCAEMTPSCRWYGFDSFEGFEHEWNMNNGQYSLHKNAFSLGGRAPDLGCENVSLVKGYFSATLPEFSSALRPGERLSFAHIDCDTFDAAECVFDHLGERIVSGTILVFDDIVGLVGCTDVMKALHAFVQDTDRSFEWLLCGRGPNEYTVLDRGSVLTHWLFAYKKGMFSAACIFK